MVNCFLSCWGFTVRQIEQKKKKEREKRKWRERKKRRAGGPFPAKGGIQDVNCHDYFAYSHAEVRVCCHLILIIG